MIKGKRKMKTKQKLILYFALLLETVIVFEKFIQTFRRSNVNQTAVRNLKSKKRRIRLSFLLFGFLSFYSLSFSHPLYQGSQLVQVHQTALHFSTPKEYWSTDPYIPWSFHRYRYQSSCPRLQIVLVSIEARRMFYFPRPQLYLPGRNFIYPRSRLFYR